MDISKLTPEEKAKLLSELRSDEEAAEKKKKEDREAYKKLKDEAIKAAFFLLETTSNSLLRTKETVFETFAEIIDMKDTLYKVKADRQTNTFTTEDGKISITIGNRMSEGYDDTVEIGITKVKDFLRTLAKDDNSAMLVDTVMGLLRKDSKGALKASKVLELEKLANESGNADFKEGIKIIKDSYRPVPSCQYIEAKYKDEHGAERNLPLSMSAISYKDITDLKK